MVYTEINTSSDNSENSNTQNVTLSAHDGAVTLPDITFVKDADMTRDGFDLVLETDQGTVTVEGYFAAEPAPNLTAPDGTALTPGLVQSFLSGGNEYADASAGSMTDTSPVGAVQEISGQATVTRVDGTVEVLGLGSPIYQGDVVETNDVGAVNIMFIDETTFAVSEDARLAIDDYVFDPATQSGTTNFSVLKGVFVFTSGLIGREDPDDVMIDTPSGSIGIRGTIIAGDVNSGEITVIEGAIVLTDLNGNSVTLANQYETARFNPSENTIDHMGEMAANDVAQKFASVSTVAADLFSSIQDSAKDDVQGEDGSEAQEARDADKPQSQDENSNDTEDEAAAQGEDEQGASNEDGEETDGETGDAAEDGEQAADGSDESSTEGQGDTSTDDTIITSQDIAPDGGAGAHAGAENDQGPANPTPPPANTPSGDDRANDGFDAGANDTQQDGTPFNIDVQRFSINENDSSGLTVARVTGNFAETTNLSLLGTAQNFYEINRIDANSLEIKLKAGIAMDAERPYKLAINASNENFGADIQRVINLNVNDLIDPTVATTGTLSFKGSDGSKFAYDFSQEFSDPDNQIISYQIVHNTGTLSDFDGGYNIDANGLATFDMIADVIGNATTFTIEAKDSDGVTLDTKDLSFTSVDAPGSAFLSVGTYFLNSSSTFAFINDAAAPTTQINASNVNAFLDGNNFGSTINVAAAATNAYVKAGGGDDIFNVDTGATGFELFGDHGQDMFNLSNLDGDIHGGSGNDTIVIKNPISMTDVQTQAGSVFDGDAGFDVIKLDMGGNINFTAGFDTNFFQNIEALDFENGQANTITLDHNIIAEMTDEKNYLKLDLDNSDTVVLDDSHVFVNTGQRDVDGEMFNTFTDGTVTLLIDADASVQVV